MHASYSLAAALVALAPAVQAQGTAFINNLCSFDVYVFPTSVGSFKGPIKISANGGTYSQQYQTFSEGGMSMKLSKTQECTDITQFEYTVSGDQVFYDVSNVNCFDTDSCPFTSEGLHMTSGSGCPSVTCQPGDAKCHEAYNLFNDDWATKACSTSEDTTLNLCSTSGSTPSSGGGILSAVSSVVSSLLPAAPSESPKKAAASTPESVSVAAAPTSSASSSVSTSQAPSSAKPTTLATSVKPASQSQSSVAAPATTAAPQPDIVYTTEIAYITQWATKWVEGREVHEPEVREAFHHEDFHQHAKPRSVHAHARRHQHE